MLFSSNLVLLAAAAVPAFGAVIDRRASGIDVKFTSVGNTEIKAVLTNVAGEDLKLFTAGSPFDTAPIKKANVFKNDAEVQFDGIARRYKTVGISEDAFTTVAAGATIETTFDVAATADLSAGGAYKVNYAGSIPYASVDSTDLVGSYNFATGDLAIEVDGAAASMVKRAVENEDIVRRSKVTSCTTAEKTALVRAITNTKSLATAAATEAAAGSTRFLRFFKSTTYAAKVAARLRAVATEATSTTTGATTYYCEDPYGYCETNVLAWTLPSNNIIANCDIYYSDLPALASTCYAQDQATTSLHEFTHANGVYSPGTDDLGYGYSAAVALSAANAYNNADSYALFANAVKLGC